MAIPEAQLETWSHQGAIRGSSTTYNTIKDILEAGHTPYSTKNYSLFLQGSYGNDTNIHTESDVDIVICLNDCFQSDQSNLSDGDKAKWRATYIDATYTHIDFKRDVKKILADNFGDDVEEGTKAITIKANANRRKADVIPAIQYRRYYKFNNINDQSFDEGICFFTNAGLMIANYPKQHHENLTTKHQSCSEWLKPMIRVMKNLRTKLVNEGKLEANIAPSYFIEGLLYNVPSDKFTTDYETCFINAFNWIKQEAIKENLVCANEQYYLLRENVSTCWPAANFSLFMDAIFEAWQTWE